MSASKPYCCSILILLAVSLSFSFPVAAEFSPSTEVQKNISILQESKDCPQCNLSGANLNRMDLSGANLEGADLSRAKLFLTNLSGANLHGADLREAKFGGADLAGADLRGADLTGASLVGAYMEGVLLDGEMVTTTPYAQNNISNVEELVYVEDTVNAKALPENDEINIGLRRDFEETPPIVQTDDKSLQENEEATERTSLENRVIEEETEKPVLPEQSAIAPDAKTAPVIENVRIEEDIEPEILHSDSTKKQLSTGTSENQVQKQEEDLESNKIDDAFAVKEEPEGIDQSFTTNEPQSDVVTETEASATALEEKQNTKNAELVQEEVVPVATVVEDVRKDETVIEEVDQTLSNASQEPVLQEQKIDVKSVETKPASIVERMLNVFSSPEPSSEVMRNVVVLLETNRCYGCNLQGVNLSGEDLEDADLEGADLRNAVLSKVDFEGANLKGADLSGADLTGADLSEADMYKASLKGANLTNASLEDTLLDDVDLSGVTGYQKTMIMIQKN